MNKKVYLDFERPLAELGEKIDDLKAHAASENIDMSSELATLEERAKKLEKEIYSNLTRWQKYQVARHPQRPYTLDYIDMLLEDFVELHGDRNFRDDPTVVGGFGRLNGNGHRRPSAGVNTAESQSGRGSVVGAVLNLYVASVTEENAGVVFINV